jgi:hypothetical protein
MAGISQSGHNEETAEKHMGVDQNPIIINWNGMNIHLPSIFGFTKYQAFDPGFALGIHVAIFSPATFCGLAP